MFGYSALILSVSVILILLLYVAKRHHVQRLIHVAHERLMSGTEESAAAALTELKPRILGLSRKQYLNFLAGTACNPFGHPIPRRAACADLIRAAPRAGIILVTEDPILRSRQTLAALGEVVLAEDRPVADRESSLNAIEDAFLRDLRFGSRSDRFGVRLPLFRERWQMPADRQSFSDWWEEGSSGSFKIIRNY